MPQMAKQRHWKAKHHLQHVVCGGVKCIPQFINNAHN